MVETYIKPSLVKWKPSELSKVHAFCAERGLEFSTLVRQVLLYVQAQPSAFARLAVDYLEPKTFIALFNAELGLEFQAPQEAAKPVLKRKRKRRGAKRGKPT